MKPIFLISVLFILFTSCASNDTKDFDGIAKRIKRINLPFYDTCGTNLTCMDFVGYDTAINTYLPCSGDNDSQKLCVIGKIYECDKYIALLLANSGADWQMHYIATFTHEGKLLSNMELLFRAGCGEEEDYWGRAECSIMENLTVNLKDSSAEFKRDSNLNIISESIVAKSHSSSFAISDNGTIVKK